MSSKADIEIAIADMKAKNEAARVKKPNKRERDKLEALDNMREALEACGPNGTATLLIIDDGGKPSSSGRTHKLEIHVMRLNTVRLPNESMVTPRPAIQEYLTINAARACGYRLSSDDRIIMGGYGYSRPQEIAQHLAHLVGHALHVETLGAGMGNVRGWVKS